MNQIHFARAMRRRGWRYARREKGTAYFSIGFPNRLGFTRAVNIRMLGLLGAAPKDLAEYLTCDAMIAVGHNPRATAA